MTRLAAIDVGSNAVRLLIKSTEGLADTYDPAIRPGLDCFVREPVRLGLDVYSKGIIRTERQRMLTETCKRFRLLMAVYRISSYRACATAAFRAASNAVEVSNRIEAATGLHIEIISGEEEARLVQKSYFAQAFEQSRNVLFVDVGGGSTDICLVADGTMRYIHSFPVGSMRMFCRNGNEAEAEALSLQLSLLADKYGPLRLVGSGGSIHKLTQLFPQDGNESVKKSSIETFCRDLSGLTVEQKIDKYHLRRDRAEIIAEAADIFLRVLNATRCDVIEAPSIGVRDGIIVDLMQKRANKRAVCKQHI